MSFAECLHHYRRLNKTSAYSFAEIYPLPLQREDFTNQNNGEQQKIPFCFAYIYIQKPAKKASAPHAMEQLDLKTEGEKKISFQKVCRAVQFQGPFHPPPQPQSGTTAQAQHPSSAAAGVEEKESLVLSAWALTPHGSF